MSHLEYFPLLLFFPFLSHPYGWNYYYVYVVMLGNVLQLSKVVFIFILFSFWFSDHNWPIMKFTDFFSFACSSISHTNFSFQLYFSSVKSPILFLLKLFALWLFSILVRHHSLDLLYFLFRISFCSLSTFTTVDLNFVVSSRARLVCDNFY